MLSVVFNLGQELCYGLFDTAHVKGFFDIEIKGLPARVIFF